MDGRAIKDSACGGHGFDIDYQGGRGHREVTPALSSALC